MEQRVVTFRVHPLQVGDKIHIEGGRRAGDWEVVAVGERKVRLHCPFSHREIEVDPFFCAAREAVEEWPGEK